MSRFIYIAFFFLFLLESHAQPIKLIENLKPLMKRADALYENKVFDEAALLYEIAYNKNTHKSEPAIKAANSYYAINNYKKAEIWYAKSLIEKELPDKTSFLNYANALMANKKYNEARELLNTYKGGFVDDPSVNQLFARLNKMPSFFKDSVLVEIIPLNINTEYVEFAPTRYGNGIVYLSDQYPPDIQNVLGWNSEKYTGFYYTEEREDGSMREPIAFQRELDAAHQMGPVVFLDNNDIIFTRSLGEVRSQELRLELMGATYDSIKHTWSDIKALPFNNENYSVGHPAVSKNGSTLIFSSDMPGGYGGMDLYISIKQNQNWSDPINLGGNINTFGNDMFPYFSSDDEIVFASDGHGGLGDLDLFRIGLSDTLNSVENLGYPINSGYADFGYIIDETGTTGYLTSNRANGGLDDDLYQFEVKWSKIRGQVIDESFNESLGHVKVEMVIAGAVKEVKYSDEEGAVEFISLANQDITFKASMKDYLLSEITLTPDDLEDNAMTQFNLAMLRKPKIKNVEKLKSRETKLKDLFNKKNALVLVDGRIFEYREIGNTQYLVNSEEKILLSKTPVNMDLPIEDRVKIATEAMGLVVEERYFLKNLYFDRNATELSDSAKFELDKVVRIMTTDLKIAFEINSYADSRGNMASNDELTFKRAQTIGRYLMENDIAGGRLIMEINGEQGILNECVDGVECIEINHAVNRRAELKLVMRKMYN